MLFADVKTKDARKCACAARMPCADSAITGDHDPGPLVKSFDVALNHGLADDARFDVGGIAFANHADEHFHGRDVVGASQVVDRVAFVTWVGLEFNDRHVAAATYFGQSLRHT